MIKNSHYHSSSGKSNIWKYNTLITPLPISIPHLQQTQHMPSLFLNKLYS